MLIDVRFTANKRGQQFVAVNCGLDTRFTNAVPLVVNCESQEEIDHYWDKRATNGGDHNVSVG